MTAPDEQRLQEWFARRFIIESGAVILGSFFALPIRCSCGRDPGVDGVVSGLIVQGRASCDDCGRMVRVRNVKNDAGSWTVIGKHARRDT